MSKKQQTFRRVLTFVLALVLALGFLSTVAFTVGAEDGNIDFDDLIAAGLPHGNCGEKVKWVLDGDMLIISGTGPMKLESSTAPWYQYKDQITSVVVQDGVTAICDYAFMNMHHVTEVSIGKNVQSIGEFAFNALLALPSLVIPDNVKTIGSEAFGLCNTMTDLVIGDGVTAIDYYAFMNCDALQTVTIGAGLASFDVSMFEMCPKLKTVTVDGANKAYTSVNGVVYSKDKTALVYIPAGVTGEFVIPSTVTQICEGALNDTYGLETLTIPDSVKKIQKQSSGEMGSVETIYYIGNATTWAKVEKINCEAFFEGKLEFRTKFAITTQPGNGAAPKGSTAKTTVKATGDGLTYAWYYKKSGATGFTKSGNQFTNTLSLKMSSAWDGAQFYCVITDAYGNSVQSKTVKLYMGNPAKITTQPANGAAPSGKTAKTTVKASGDGLTYTWYYMKSGATSYTKSGNQTTNVLSLKMSSAWDDAKFYCVVTDKYGTSVKTSVVTLNMKLKAAISTQPTNAAAPKGSTAKVTVKATGDGLTYQWYYAKKGSSTFKKISGATKATYSLKMSSSNNGRKVYCVVKDKYGTSVKTKTVTLYMGNPAKIVTQPKSVKVAPGQAAKLTVKASGDGLKYAWYYMKSGATKYTKSGNQTTKTLSVKMSATWNGAKFYCVITDKYGTSVKTDTVKMSMGNPAKIVTQPKSVKVAPNQAAKLTVKASGDGLTYAWYYMKSGATKYTKSGNQTTSTLSVKMSATWNGAKFYCVVTDKYGTSVKTDTVKMSMGNPVKITAHPQNVTVAEGEVAKATVKATGDGLKYTWYEIGVAGGASTESSITSATYSVTMSEAVNGLRVYCIVSDQYGNKAMSNPATLTMEAKKPQIDWTMGSWTYTGLYCEGEYNEFNMTFAGDGSFGNVNVAYWQVLSQEEINEYLEMGWSMDDFREIEGEYCANFHGTFRDFCVVNQKGNTLTLVVDYGEDGENIGTLTLELQEDKSLKILSVDNFVSDDALQVGKFFTWVEPEPSQMAMITSAPKGAFGDYGETVSLTVEAEGENLTYQWYEIVLDELNGGYEEVLLPDFTGNSYSEILDPEDVGKLIYCRVLDDKYHYDHTEWMVLDYTVPTEDWHWFVSYKLSGDKQELFESRLSCSRGLWGFTKWRPQREGESLVEPGVAYPEQDVISTEYKDIDGVRYHQSSVGWARGMELSLEDGLIKASIETLGQVEAVIYFERTAFDTMVVVRTTGTISETPGFIENFVAGDVFKHDV